MRNLLIIGLLAVGAIPACSTLDVAAVGELVETHLAGDDRWTEPMVKVSAELAVGDDGYLAAVTVTEEWISDLLLLYVVHEGGRYKLADVKDDLPSTMLSETQITLSAVEEFAEPLYVLEFGEESYGSGFGGEYDFYDAFYLDDGGLKHALRDATRVIDVGYSRWYGGFDSTAWQDGYYHEERNKITWDDLDGDGRPEALVLRKSRKDPDEEYAFSGAHLYSVNGTADAWGQGFLYDEELLYKEVTDSSFDSALEARGDDVAYTILYEKRLWYDGDVPAALEMLGRVKSLTDDAEVAAGCDVIAAKISRYADDPPEAVRLFYAQEYDRVRENYPGTGVWTEVHFLSFDAGDCLWCVENFPDDPRWAERVQWYVYGALIGDEGPDLKTAERYVKELLKGDWEPEEKAQTCVYLADGYIQEGDFKKARKYYETAYDVDPTGAFGDYAASRMVEYYDPVADAEKRLEWMLKTVRWDTFGWWRGDVEDELENIVRVTDNGAAIPINELIIDGENPTVWFDAGDFDGDGALELEATALFRDAGRRRLYVFEREKDAFKQVYDDEHGFVGVVTVEEVFAGRPAIIYGAETVEGGFITRSRRILSYIDGEYHIIGDIATAETDAATGEVIWSGELRFEPDEKEPRAYVEVVDYTGTERLVVETKGVYEYNGGGRRFVEVSE
ncbi:MAG: tetratricopeptide repeat protein [Candidatus Coatesbacteria bacterium]|nr:MAG: tetratricopeptide repeat protein [Candidatus Coatesbacteria bacterium]